MLGVVRRAGSTSRCADRRPVLAFFFVAFAASLLFYRLLGFSYFPQTDAGQFVVTLKAPSGTKLTVTEREVARSWSDSSKRSSGPMISAILVDNIGVDNGFSAVYTLNALFDAHRIRAVGLTPGRRVWQL